MEDSHDKVPCDSPELETHQTVTFTSLKQLQCLTHNTIITSFNDRFPDRHGLATSYLVFIHLSQKRTICDVAQAFYRPHALLVIQTAVSKHPFFIHKTIPNVRNITPFVPILQHQRTVKPLNTTVLAQIQHYTRKGH